MFASTLAARAAERDAHQRALNRQAGSVMRLAAEGATVLGEPPAVRAVMTDDGNFLEVFSGGEWREIDTVDRRTKKEPSPWWKFW